MAQFVNLSMGALGVYGETSTSSTRFLSDLVMNKKEIDFILCKICNMFIRCTATYFSVAIENGATLSFSISN